MATISNLNFNNMIRKEAQRIGSMDETLGTGLMQPNNATNSSSRKLMFNQHLAQSISIKGAERPLIATGYENLFGKRSSSFVLAEYDYDVIAKIPKFSAVPDHHYYLITYSAEKNELGVIEAISYAHITESYGYQFNNSALNELNVGSYIGKGSILQKSTSFDEYNNRMDGTNLISAYMSSDNNMEDGIILSDVAADKLESILVKPVSVIVNDNDIPLNLYGEGNTYKAIPDIGEYIKDGILCAIRREKKEESLYMQSKQRLKDVMMSDEKYPVEGKVVDINIRCNNPEALMTEYNAQLKYYYEESMRVNRNIVSAIDVFIEANIGTTMTYDLQKLYSNAKRILNGTQFSKEGKVFSNVIIEIVVLEENKMRVGDKLSDRYGGKGVISKIVPQNMMPLLDNGQYVEAIWNMSTCVNRENPGQLFETSSTHIGQRTIDFMNTNVLTAEEYIGIYEEYVNAMSGEQGDYYSRILDDLSDEEKQHFVDSIISDGGINVALRPMTETMDIFKLMEIYDEFPWATPSRVKVPIVGSNGKVRYVEANRPLICGKKYVYRLKQYAEEKFSATSLSSTNIRNENSRSRASKNFKAPYTRTPIRFGEMESGDLNHLGVEYVVFNLMLHSASPHGRRLVDQMFTGDPYNIDIKLDSYSKNRNAEIANTHLKTMGLRLVFEKVKKEMIHPISKYPVTFKYKDKHPELVKPVWFLSEGEKCSPEYDEIIMNLDKYIQPISKYPVTFLTEDHKGVDYYLIDPDADKEKDKKKKAN